MTLTAIQGAILRRLVGARGGPIGLPTLASITEDDLLTAIEGLQARRYVRVVGPPNMNSPIGQDVDELLLLPAGIEAARRARS